MYLYHYFDSKQAPFMTISDLSLHDANQLLNHLKRETPNSQHADRHDHYAQYRRNCETILRTKFLEKNGIIERQNPHYMTLGHSPWLNTWFENCDFIKIPIEAFDTRTLSFTYGDAMPTFSPTIQSEKPYFHQLYTFEEIKDIIKEYGYPQDWNDDGKQGYERYIEVQIWSDRTVKRFRDAYLAQNSDKI